MLGATLAGEVKRMYLMQERIIINLHVNALSNNHIPEEVHDNLVDTVHKYLPLLHRYTKLRQNY